VGSEKVVASRRSFFQSTLRCKLSIFKLESATRTCRAYKVAGVHIYCSPLESVIEYHILGIQRQRSWPKPISLNAGAQSMIFPGTLGSHFSWTSSCVRGRQCQSSPFLISFMQTLHVATFHVHGKGNRWGARLVRERRETKEQSELDWAGFGA